MQIIVVKLKLRPHVRMTWSCELQIFESCMFRRIQIFDEFVACNKLYRNNICQIVVGIKSLYVRCVLGRRECWSLHFHVTLHLFTHGKVKCRVIRFFS